MAWFRVQLTEEQQRIVNQAVLTGDTARRFVMLMPEGSLGWALLPPVGMADQVSRVRASFVASRTTRESRG